MNNILPSDNKNKLFNETESFSLQDFDKSVFDRLHKWMRDIIEKSPEYQALDATDKDDLPF